MKTRRLLILPSLIVAAMTFFSCSQETEEGIVGVWAHPKSSSSIVVETNYPELTSAIIRDMQVDREMIDYSLTFAEDGTFQYIQGKEGFRKGVFAYNGEMLTFDNDIHLKVSVRNNLMTVEQDASEAYTPDIIADLIAYDETLAHIDPSQVVLKKAAYVNEYSRMAAQY